MWKGPVAEQNLSVPAEPAPAARARWIATALASTLSLTRSIVELAGRSVRPGSFVIVGFVSARQGENFARELARMCSAAMRIAALVTAPALAGRAAKRAFASATQVTLSATKAASTSKRMPIIAAVVGSCARGMSRVSKGSVSTMRTNVAVRHEIST